MAKGSLLLLPSSPALSTVQVLGSTNFAPIGFVFPTDGHDRQAVENNLKYAWKEIRRWHRSFSILCDETEDEDVLHFFHLLVSSLFLLLSDSSSDTIDRHVRKALQPLREWAGTVVRTPEEHADLMRNVRVSMLELHQVIQDVNMSHLSSKQVAEINTNMDEVAIFLKLKVKAAEHEVSESDQHGVQESSQVYPEKQKKGFVARLFGRMRRSRPRK